MADDNRSRRERPRPCPFGCGAEVPASARFCPGCAKQVVEFCTDCGHRIRRPRGDNACPGCGARPVAAPAAGPPQSRSTSRCGFCGFALTGQDRCPQCNSFTKTFKRLCTSCKKEVGLTDNDCKHCGVHFVYSLDSGHKIFRHIKCRNCHRPPVEFDDWMALRNIAFVFQTERGVKTRILQSDPDAEDKVRRYFGEDDVLAYRTGEDESPWDFPSDRELLSFLHNFACLCKARDWKLARMHGAWTHAKPHVHAGGKATGSFLSQAWKDLINVLERLGGR